MGHILVKSDYNPRQYESRSLLNEAVENRANGIMKEWEVSSIYNGPDRAAVEIMHKHRATHNEIAWVLVGDEITKSNEVYAYIDSVLKQVGAPAPTPVGRGMYNVQDGQRQWKGASELLGLGEGGEGKGGLSGGASQGTAGGAEASHPSPQRPGLGSRLKTWAKERAMPAIGRGMQHGMAGIVGGSLTGNPLGALAGIGGSMAASHRAKKQGVDAYGNPLQQGEGLGQIAADAGRQFGQNVKDFGRQQAENYQTGQGAAGAVGRVAGALGHAGRGIRDAVSGAWGAAGADQQQQLQQQNPQLAREQQRQANPTSWSPEGQAAQAQADQAQLASATPFGQGFGVQPQAQAQQPQAQSQESILANTPTTPFPGNAQVDPAIAQQVAQPWSQNWGGQQPQQTVVGRQQDTAAQQLAAMETQPIQTSSDAPSSAYSSIEAILKGL